MLSRALTLTDLTVYAPRVMRPNDEKLYAIMMRKPDPFQIELEQLLISKIHRSNRCDNLQLNRNARQHEPGPGLAAAPSPSNDRVATVCNPKGNSGRRSTCVYETPERKSISAEDLEND